VTLADPPGGTKGGVPQALRAAIERPVTTANMRPFTKTASTYPSIRLEPSYDCAVTVAFIPSPKHGIVDIGPLPLHAYGLMLAIGVLVAAKVAETRWKRRGRDPQEFAAIVVPVVISGVIGARIYHLFTGYNWSDGGLVGTFQIWKGGLSIWGAVGGGLIALMVLARRHKLDALLLMDVIAPGVVLAQAIGRWGNYFNQELFGRPTKLPWALEIDRAHRPPGYLTQTTFHPTFLYESLWCLLVFGTLLFVERRFTLKRGQTFALYVAMYTFGRIWFEALRIDDATHIFGVRFNLLLSIVLCVFGTVWFVWLGRRPQAEADSGISPIRIDTPAQ
jgi:phosphatidylglycerol---prolipoprotein diacylglyceryl transferase